MFNIKSTLNWRCYTDNQKDLGSKPTRHSIEFWNPISLWGSRWISGGIKNPTEWLTLSWWGWHLMGGPKLAMGQPSSSLKTIKQIKKVFTMKCINNYRQVLQQTTPSLKWHYLRADLQIFLSSETSESILYVFLASGGTIRGTLRGKLYQELVLWPLRHH